MPALVGTLFDGPLDIVGDVHGEIAALHALLGHLGYRSDGTHPAGRRLVFVGDLTDRGPDSPAVMDLIQRYVDAGRAQCVLGNHDLNILLDHTKLDNHWFYGQQSVTADGYIIPQRPADQATRQRILAFFDTLPIALERDDLRVVHACWNDPMIEMARAADDVVRLYHEHRELIERSFPDLDLDDIDRGLEHQNRNPVKKLTSGPEERVEEPVEASGKVRNERRVQWWNDYRDTFCVFGHYSLPADQQRGNQAAFCVDYGVGKRWTERRAGKTSGFSWKLAALRFPEKDVQFDEGERVAADFAS
jgi:hypothetical protein